MEYGLVRREIDNRQGVKSESPVPHKLGRPIDRSSLPTSHPEELALFAATKPPGKSSVEMSRRLLAQLSS